MNSSALADGIRDLRRKLAVHQLGEDSDEQLLYAFTSRRDDSAFAVLMRRHGPMVLHVCRRVLAHEQDAEDAFQATFLVLAQSAAALRDKTTLASFLHGTAYRTAMKAKQSAARRRKHEGKAPSRPSADPADELSWREVQILLDEEVARLPEIYQGVFVACCLEGLSREEAAQRLGLKEGTVSSRLTTARKKLAKQLARRGVDLTMVLTAMGLAASSASALSAGLMATTIKAALAVAAGEKLAGIVSASVAQLAKSATIAMAVNKAKIATVLFLTATLLAGGSVWAYRGLAAPSAEPPAAKTDAQPQSASPKREASKTIEIEGRVFDPGGKPKAGAKLLMLDKEGGTQQIDMTGADGRFLASVSKEAKFDYLLAQAEGFGLDFLQISKSDLKKPIEFHLAKDRPIRGRVVNTEGKPVAGVRVAVNSFNAYADNSLDSFLIMWKKRNENSGVPSGEKHLWTETAWLLPSTTDAGGRFVLHGVGVERFVSLRFSGAGIAEVEQWIVNRDGFDPKPYNQATLDNASKGFGRRAANRWMLQGPDVSIVAEAEKPIRGMVNDADSGEGRPGVVVRLTRINNGNLVAPHAQAKTDAQGRYELHGARKFKRYMLEVSADTTAGFMGAQVWADDSAGYQPIDLDIKVKKGVIITGRIIDNASGKPIPGFAMADILNNNPFAKAYPEFNSSAWLRTSESISEDGRFRVVAMPGPVVLMGGPLPVKNRFEFNVPKSDSKYPQYFSKDPKFKAAYYRFGGGLSLIQGNFCKVLEIKPDARGVEQDIVLERASVLPVRIQDADGKPLSGVWVAGLNPEDWHYPIRCDNAECSVYQLEPGKPRVVVFFDAERKLAGTLALKGDEKEPVTAKLSPVGAIKGRLLDAEDKPLAGVVVDVYYPQRAAEEIHKRIHVAKQIVTDTEGAFALDDLIPGQKLELSFHHGKRKFEQTPKRAHPMIEVKSGECRELGAIKMKRMGETTEE